MHTSPMTVRPTPRRTATRSRCTMESLERRTLMSGSWVTADSLPPAAGTNVESMSADGLGNVYATGAYNGQGILREKIAGSSGFVTVTTPPDTNFNEVFADPQGDVFLNGIGGLYERAVGQQTWAVVPFNIPAGASGWVSGDTSVFAADAAGNVFGIGPLKLPTGTTTSHGKTTTTYAFFNAVFEKKAGQTSFTPVYQESDSTFSPYGITIIPSGPSAGIYLLEGPTGVLKSTDGGLSFISASSIPVFSAYDGFAIASDSIGNGNVYVASDHIDSVLTGYTYSTVKGKVVKTPVYTSTSYLVTQRSSDGGATWTVVDNPTFAGHPFANDIADFNGTVYVTAETDFTSGDGIIRSNVNGGWQTVDDTGGNVYTTLAIDASGTPYAGGITDTALSHGLGWSIRSGPPAAAATAAPAMAAFAAAPTAPVAGTSAPVAAVSAGRPVQPGPQPSPVFAASGALSDDLRIIDQVLGKRSWKYPTLGRRPARVP